MKAFIESTKDGLPHNNNFFSAYQGFSELGWETVFFYDYDQLNSKKEDIIVGYVETVRNRLSQFGVTTPEIDYPDELKSFLGRRVWRARMLWISVLPMTVELC